MTSLKYLLPFIVLFLSSCQHYEMGFDEVKTIKMNLWPQTQIEGSGEMFAKQLVINETYFEDIECEMIVEIMTEKFSIWFGKTLSTVNFTNDSILFYSYDFENKIPNSDLIRYSSSVNTFKPTISNKYTIKWKHSMGKVMFSIKNGEQIFEKQFTKQENELMEMFWGAPYFGVSTGIVNIIESKLKLDCNEKPKFAIYGDSFIEGSTMKSTLNQRWAYLFANAVGKQNCPLNGKAGDLFSQAFINRFTNENNWIKSKYVILALGANSYNLEEYKNNLLKAISITLQNGQTPILCTSTPGPYNKKILEQMNNFVRNLNLQYIDFHKALTQENNPLKWKDGLCISDSIHPSIKGHQTMYETILNTSFH